MQGQWVPMQWDQCRMHPPVPLRLLVLEGCLGSSAGLNLLQLAPWESSVALGGARGLGVSAPVLSSRFPLSW